MYYAKELMSCFELEFTYLQKIEITSGLKHGLDNEDVKVYAQRESFTDERNTTCTGTSYF